MVNPDTYEIKLIDFGFATKFDGQGGLNGKIGTPYYVAPEVIKGTYGKECDMWSIGIMTYYMLIGEPPFSSDSSTELYMGADNKPYTKMKEFDLLFDNIVNLDVPYDHHEWERCSPEAIDFVQKLLVKNPHKRMTAEEAMEHPWILGKDVQSSPSGTQPDSDLS